MSLYAQTESPQACLVSSRVSWSNNRPLPCSFGKSLWVIDDLSKYSLVHSPFLIFVSLHYLALTAM